MEKVLEEVSDEFLFLIEAIVQINLDSVMGITIIFEYPLGNLLFKLRDC
jgi:hypothetical protein